MPNMISLYDKRKVDKTSVDRSLKHFKSFISQYLFAAISNTLPFCKNLQRYYAEKYGAVQQKFTKRIKINFIHCFQAIASHIPLIFSVLKNGPSIFIPNINRKKNFEGQTWNAKLFFLDSKFDSASKQDF